MSASEYRTTSRSVMPGMPATGQTRRLALDGVAGVPGRCRDQVRTALEDWGWLPTADPDQRARADDVLLIVSELATNACRHAGGPDQLVLSVTALTLRIEVLDRSDALPSPQVPHVPTRIGGHGLHTVALLASRWGHLPRADRPGKAVWAEIDLPRG
ncbi:ATP-binding protein [Kitasatospora sp. NPDC059327]|uniref:ATP-binding protein n=1 Tax=Kitasatospora sp. NPDC059327 TaxID=3346803 RepID=UPI0036B286EA